MDRDEIAADVLRSCHTQLKKALSPRDHVVDHLYQAKIISLEEKVRVQDQRLQQSQADELLMILAGRCTWAIVQELIKALEDATLRSQHELADWLKSQLRSKGVQNGRTSATPEPEVPTVEVGARYQADRDYTAKRPGCLSVQQDEIVTLREVTDTGWWKIKNGRGKVGWVPGFLWERAQAFAEDTANMGAERVCPPIYQLLVRGIVREPWFFSDITRDQGEAILHSYGKNNAFLVRTSQSAGNGLALAVYYDGEVDTFKIDVKANGHLKVGEMQFETMKVLIRYYTQHPVVAEDNRRVFLGEPAKRQ
eukprot:scpid70457/ scgid2893/ Cytoplasmic protein NCK1; NCK adaptor protein 1; SH2/SH3 adaptor protein NCK-alpha